MAAERSTEKHEHTESDLWKILGVSPHASPNGEKDRTASEAEREPASPEKETGHTPSTTDGAPASPKKETDDTPPKEDSTPTSPQMDRDPASPKEETGDTPPKEDGAPTSSGAKCDHKRSHVEFRPHKYTTNRSKRLPFVVTIPTKVCDQCGNVEELGNSAPIDKLATEQARRDLHLLTGPEITTIRESLGLSRRKFAALAGVGLTTLARWEGSEAIQNVGYDHLMRLLQYRENVDRLAALTEVRLPRMADRAAPRQPEAGKPPAGQDRPAKTGRDFSRVAAEAEQELVERIKALPAVAFASMVTTLFSGLGYVITPLSGGAGDEPSGFLAAAGSDPLGITHPQVRVIIRTSEVQENDVAGVEQMLKASELGTLVTQAGATPAAHAAAQAASKRIQIIDTRQLCGMWATAYERLQPAQQALLPLQKISFFAGK